MTEPSTVHSTSAIERNYPYTPNRLFNAFAEPAMKRRWYAGGTHEVEVFTMDFNVGGGERIESRFGKQSPFPGVALVVDGVIQNILTNRRIVTASKMTVGAIIVFPLRLSQSILIEVEGGTNLICAHQGAFFEGSDAPRIRKAGWHALLDRLGADLSP